MFCQEKNSVPKTSILKANRPKVFYNKGSFWAVKGRGEKNNSKQDFIHLGEQLIKEPKDTNCRQKIKI